MKVKILCEKKIGLQALTQVHSYHTNFPPEIPLLWAHGHPTLD